MTDTRSVQGNGAEPEQAKEQVFWSILFERTLDGNAVDALLDISLVSGMRGYQRISLPYMQTAMARNRAVRSFLDVSQNPNDVLVMLDGDHVHPHDIIYRLASHDPELGVVGALYFRRGEPYDPMFFRRTDGTLRNPAEWDRGMIYECDAVGTGAIAIRRWVFDKLEDAGVGSPWFQYKFPPDSDYYMTEDIFFAELCEGQGIHHYCDTGLLSVHIGAKFIDEREWEAYKDAHPEIVQEPVVQRQQGG